MSLVTGSELAIEGRNGHAMRGMDASKAVPRSFIWIVVRLRRRQVVENILGEPSRRSLGGSLDVVHVWKCPRNLNQRTAMQLLQALC